MSNNNNRWEEGEMYWREPVKDESISKPKVTLHKSHKPWDPNEKPRFEPIDNYPDLNKIISEAIKLDGESYWEEMSVFNVNPEGEKKSKSRSYSGRLDKHPIFNNMIK